MPTYSLHNPTYGNRTSRLRRAANATRYAAMAARFRAFQRGANDPQSQRSAANTLQHDDILQPIYNDIPGPDQADGMENESDGDESQQEIECPWVNLSADVPITHPIDLVLQSRIEQHQREATQFNLRSLNETLHPTYMALKYRTQNWTGPEAEQSFVNCTCLADTITTHTANTDVKWHSGYLAGSPVQPQTAFSMRLMIFHNDLWNHCHVGAMPFTEVLREWLEPRSERLCVKNKAHARDLHKPFSVAVDLFRRLNDMTDSLVMAALKLNEKEKLAMLACPACFGPQPHNSDQYPEKTRNRLIICLDGNFQHRHHTKASCEEVIQTPGIFLEQSKVDSMLGDIRLAKIKHSPPAQADQCADAHKATDDCRNESTRILKAIEPTRNVGILYDIGCSLDKFIKIRHLFEEDQGRIQFGTSIFHAKYQTGFFMQQWRKQRRFQLSHTKEDNDHRLKLVKLYKDKAILELLRKRLTGPELFLATPEEVDQLLDNISRKANELTSKAELLHRTVTGKGEQRSEEQRLLLLLWDAKSTLFTHAVNLHAERQPVVNSRTIGARLGTKLKEKIFKAIQARRPAVNKSIAAFNKCYANYISKFPNQSLSEFSGNLNYETFAALPLDDKFWNDGLYFHSKAAWAVDPNVCAGINCVLILSRIQEEFQLIAQELTRAVGWAISHHNHLKNYIAYIENRYEQLRRYHQAGSVFPNVELEEEDFVPLDHIDAMRLGGMNRRQKMKIVAREMKVFLDKHKILVEQWSEDVLWLWSRCQPLPNRPHIHQWHELMARIATQKAREEAIDEDVEEAAIDMGALDGEDTSKDWIRETDLTGIEDNLANL
ncbi:hypothetical protein PCASD_01704 [Puccinia coronata f. sp. avenae]|uniref:CxC1-like cysteine cluster associated with KDZ transposases domain-containing protein n=1 Tax=Puccinia coronata f. sp. avenae TaxID=200324 RepID=A0A2N5VJV7_9BASI|nr:hypothetical protein PCASD_01704 [Puccinia coronata f. sp. avenae]